MRNYPQLSAKDLKASLARLYSSRQFYARSWQDHSNHGFIGIHLIERSVDLLASALNGNLLDVGCGSQPYRKYFTHLDEYVGCDFDAKRGSVDFECAADSIPVDSGTFDSILCTEVLEHTPRPSAVWSEFHRVLKPGGKVLLTTPMYWPSHEQPYDFYRYPGHGLLHLAESAGFRVLELIPRGGVWAFLAQATMQSVPQYFPFKIQRTIWNRAFIEVDRRRTNPNITIGWTLLAEKSLPSSQ